MSDVFQFPNPKIAANGCVAPPVIAALTQAQIDDVSNGCGPSGAKFDLVPDKIAGLDLYPGCSIHDVTYNFGEDESDKQWGTSCCL